MPEFEFDVDASIAAGWDQFVDHLAGFLRDLLPGATFDVAVPALGEPSVRAPFVRFTCTEPGRLHVEVSADGPDEASSPLYRNRSDQLVALGWTRQRTSGDAGGTPGVHLVRPIDHALETARLVAVTMEQVFGIPHPVFLHDVATFSPDTGDYASEPMDFRPVPIGCPDDATRAMATALAQVYAREVPADENDVFTVPAGLVLLFVRAHRSLPLIVFRSPLVSSVVDTAAAEHEVATLNRDSLWCRYVFDGDTIYAESELVDRVFLPVNFKIQLTEVCAELDDIYPDLARRVAGKRWHDLRTAEDGLPGEQ